MTHSAIQFEMAAASTDRSVHHSCLKCDPGAWRALCGKPRPPHRQLAPKHTQVTCLRCLRAALKHPCFRGQ